MESRLALKRIREFAMRELKEKQADRVCVRRVKLKSLMKRGWLPDMRIRGMEGAHHLVCGFYGDIMRMYYVGKEGELLGAAEFAGAEMDRVWRDISKRTRVEFSIRRR